MCSGSNRAASILLYHVIPVPALAAALTDNQVLPTALGVGYTLTVRKGGAGEEDGGSGVTIVGKANNATVVMPDVVVCTSVVHIVNRVLLPEASLTAIPIFNTTAATPTMAPGMAPAESPEDSPVTPTPPTVGTPPGEDGGNATTPTGAASTLAVGSLVFGLTGAVAAAFLL